MKITWIAALIESTYYNGRVQSDDKKLDYDDFLQFARVSNGDQMRALWYDEKQRGNVNLYFSDSIVTEVFPVKKKGRYRVIQFEEDAGVVKLPHAMGIMRVAPVVSDNEECDDDYDGSDIFLRGEPGQENTFGAADLLDDLGERFYVPIGNTLRLFGDKDVDQVEVDYIKNDEDLEIPEAIGIAIIKDVLKIVMPGVNYSVDTTDNADPNVTTYKQRLADPQGL